MKKHIFAALWLTFTLMAAPVLGQPAEGCFGQDSSGEGRVANPCQTAKCYRGLNGRGEVIKWAKTRAQCQHQTNGMSWGYPGNAVNIYRDVFPK